MLGYFLFFTSKVNFLIAFLASDAVKQLVVDLLSEYAKRTDNTVDDYAVNLIKRELFGE